MDLFVVVNLLNCAAKSPSLSEEHFLAINGNGSSSSTNSSTNALNNTKYSTLSDKKVNELGSSAHNLNNSKATTNDLSLSQNSSNVDDEDTDADGDSGDKSATLKASIQLNTLPSTHKINRFNSDKSIYYSSVNLLNWTKKFYKFLKKFTLGVIGGIHKSEHKSEWQ